MGPEFSIRFQHRAFSDLRHRLLADLSKEHWAIVLGKTAEVGSLIILKAYEILYPAPEDYEDQSRAFLRLRRDFVHRVLSRLLESTEMDTIIDVHTHPFSESRVAFSAVDDGDETGFFRFLQKRFDELHYASIVLSQTEYSARVWTQVRSKPQAQPCTIRTQTSLEQIPSSDKYLQDQTHFRGNSGSVEAADMFHRSALALGVDVMRRIVTDQTVAIAGLGGLGSVIAEHLLHSGFHKLILIDPDVLEISNLSRVVGAFFQDAAAGIAKVDAIAQHLRRINPEAEIVPLQLPIEEVSVAEHVARADWLVVATDNHSSRKTAQLYSLEYFVPLISIGVNITVSGREITDMSGEVITARVGDRLCLFCLGRIDFSKIASEVHPEEHVRSELVRRGYVQGEDVKEPAVKTLNTMVSTLGVDSLLNQYVERTAHRPIIVYENNSSACIYEDVESLERRRGSCFTCCLGA